MTEYLNEGKIKKLYDELVQRVMQEMNNEMPILSELLHALGQVRI
jgi:hypothetical protein